MAALAKDVIVVKTLPKNLKGERRKKKIPVFKVPFAASPYYYQHHVLPMLKQHQVVELVVSEGGCLQVMATSLLFILVGFPLIEMIHFLFQKIYESKI